jgi:hypothetical protein
LRGELLTGLQSLIKQFGELQLRRRAKSQFLQVFGVVVSARFREIRGRAVVVSVAVSDPIRAIR